MKSFSKYCLCWSFNLIASVCLMLHVDVWYLDRLCHGVVVYSHMSAPIAPACRTSLAFYTHRTRASRLFIKKSVKLHSVACQLLKKKVHVVLFEVSKIHPKKYYSRIQYFPMRYTNNNEKWSPFLEEYLSS